MDGPWIWSWMIDGQHPMHVGVDPPRHQHRDRGMDRPGKAARTAAAQNNSGENK